MKARNTWKKAAVAAACAAAAAGAHAQSSVTVYGLVDAGIEYGKAGGTSSTRLVSGGSVGSRIGFRGVEDLGGGLAAVFRLETGINLDDGTIAQGGRGFGRESSVGLAHREAGTVQFGRLPTPYFSVQSAVDAFQWMGAGGLPALTRSGTATTQVLPMAVNARHDNAIGYVSPKWGGFELRALYSLGEDSATLGNGYGLSGRYTSSRLDLVAGFTRQSAGTAGSGHADAFVVGGSYDFGPARVYAGYTVERNNCTNCTGALARPPGVAANGEGEFQIINLGARVPVGAFVAIAQVARVQDRTTYAVNRGDRDATWWAVGGEYYMSKRTVLYTTYGSINNQNGSQYALGTGSAQRPAGSVPAGDPRASSVNVGMRRSF